MEEKDVKGYYVVITLGIDAENEQDAHRQLHDLFANKWSDNTWLVETHVIAETDPNWPEEE